MPDVIFYLANLLHYALDEKPLLPKVWNLLILNLWKHALKLLGFDLSLCVYSGQLVFESLYFLTLPDLMAEIRWVHL